MCGICGILNFGKEAVDVKILKEMNQAHFHRGPDEEGVFLKGQAGLGIRRLSIIDLRGGSQPIHNENGQIQVVCNGEIYNFLELRRELEIKAHKFYTKSDTEVIVHLYEELGDEFAAKLNGMFALALWDEGKQKLVIARDRLGKKPLYYGLWPDKFIFASEMKSILVHPNMSRELDYNAVSKYFTYEFIPAPNTAFSRIKKLLPGHKLIVELEKKENVRIEKYWDIKFFDSPEAKWQDEDAAAQRLDVLLKEAVRKRLISDVELGAFLSGGIDSSYIVSLMAELAPGKIKTFNIAFEDKSFDESRYARSVSAYFNTQHYEAVLNQEKMLQLIPKICDFLDEPLADASIVPTYLLSAFAREHVKAALSGDGADELFAGYPTYFAHVLAEAYLKLPSLIRKNLSRLFDKLPVSFDNFSLDFKIKKFMSALEYEPQFRNCLWLGSFSPNEKEHLFCGEFKECLKKGDEFEDINFHLANCSSKKSLEKFLYLDAKLYLQDGVLVKVDRASMAASLEVRSPFLDYEFVEFAAKLPPSFKLNKFRSKSILKKAAGKRLPRGIINRKKKGFGIPAAKWINGELKPFVLDVLERSKIERQKIFNYACVEKILNEHFRKQKDNRKLIWTLLIFQMWFDKYKP